ncbi:methionine--tRNA ligase [candidate division WS5 bacterium]|uniref:methionine--tRNA ligase n=1 Tax=candidate division WS5 bacterium TaxID=2093353 RepID=A0A419DG27_9BACT|nr:MAG: methionine--tRNA ligase [candidate division WS5 bacterium]
MSKYYITTPIYYVNDVPHLGHAYTSIAADVLARHRKIKGDDVFLLTGTDEHGAKIAEAAKKAGKSPQDFVDGLVPKFESLCKVLNIQYNQFFRTTNPKHEKIVQELIGKLKDAGYIEKRKYEGLYCVGCEKFLTKDDLVEGKCPDHKTAPVTHSEENYFFLLTKIAQEKDLYGLIKSDKFKVSPVARKNEVLGKIKAGLEDVSISRESVEWGVKFPGDEKQTVYVWVDALINYYSATKIYKNGPTWPADLHLVGKDILWFHAVIWPAMLLAIGEKLPKEVFAHGFFTIGGYKMSKTVGNVLDPGELVEKFGADAVRYAILREFPFGEDGDISEEKIANRYESDLSNGIGNLLQRTLSMVNKYDVKIKNSDSLKDIPFRGNDMDDFQKLNKAISGYIENLNFFSALNSIMLFVKVLNEFIDQSQPWKLAKENKNDELSDALSYVYNSLSDIVGYIDPFMPETSEKMKKQLKDLKPEPLFPRLES